MINILYLYYDLLNLYGENANVRCIIRNLELNKIKANVDLKSLNDEIDFDKYDIVYIGSGSEEDILISLEDLKKRKKDIIKYIENDKYLFLTGNSMIMFGKTIDTLDKKIDGLDIFKYYSKYVSEDVFHNASKNRIVGEIIGTCKLINNKIIGFQNRCDLVYNINNTLFKLDKKYSNDLNDENEGFTYKNVFATHIIGPLFVRNPYLIDYFLNKICSEKNINYKSLDDDSKKAYKKYLDNFL